MATNDLALLGSNAVLALTTFYTRALAEQAKELEAARMQVVAVQRAGVELLTAIEDDTTDLVAATVRYRRQVGIGGQDG